MKRFLILASLMAVLVATGLSGTAAAWGPCCCGSRYACGYYGVYNRYPNYGLCGGYGCCRGRGYNGCGCCTYFGPSVIVGTPGYGSSQALYSGNGMASGYNVGAYGR